MQKLGIKYSDMVLYYKNSQKEKVNFNPSYTFEVYSVGSDTIPEDVQSDGLTEHDTIVTIAVSGDLAGYLWVSKRDTYQIKPIEQNISIRGSYIWKVYVFRSHRGKGIATQLLRYSVQREAFHSPFFAFVAANNIPSRKLFRSVGFSPIERKRLVKIGSLKLQY